MKKIFQTISLVSFSIFLFIQCSSHSNKAEVDQAFTCSAVDANAAPKLLWTLKNQFEAPESSLYDPQSNAIYVSNVVGSPMQKDHKGYISKISLDGKMITKKWVRGFDAPKGLRIHGDSLWVSDINRIHSVSIAKHQLLSTITLSDAKFLNDIAIDEAQNDIYVSDMLSSRIYKIKEDQAPQVVAEGPELENPNGLVFDKNSNKLIIASWGPDIQPDFTTKNLGQLLTLDLSNKSIQSWNKKTTRLGHLDGLEVLSDEEVLVSDWVAGKVFAINRHSKCRILLEGFQGSADIGWVADKRILLVPQMGANSLSAYEVPAL
jgi:sugar lactone lactonase YvrE